MYGSGQKTEWQQQQQHALIVLDFIKKELGIFY